MQDTLDRWNALCRQRKDEDFGRPPGTMDPANYVLHNFTADERVLLPAILDAAVDAILLYVTEGIDAATRGIKGKRYLP